MFRSVIRMSSGWFLWNKNASAVKYFRKFSNVLQDIAGLELTLQLLYIALSSHTKQFQRPL